MDKSNNKMDKSMKRGREASGGEREDERNFIFLFLSSFLSQIYENRTVGFRRG